ncbi:MAG: hypothetical protein L6R42_006989 [Xanthoria sp. 1 TBL-2021]|nr:MAG: hypothetical protein L6R42_006989 [Xanthoria sp. 1 TBL-2021]
MAVHNIVVIGASYAGLGTAHYLLRYTIPSLEKASNSDSTTYKLTLISATTHFYHKVGAPRFLASPDLIPLSKAFLPIADGFKSYSPSKFELIIGEAHSLNDTAQTIAIKETYDSSSPPKTVSYNTLILATGASSESPLWSIPGSHERTISALKSTQSALPNAKTVLIAGGGPAGVETAGEIASLFPKIDITLLSGADRLLTRLRPAISAAAESRLQAMSVKVVHGTRAERATSDVNGATEVALDDGSVKVVDLYIEATGIRPNTAFLPKSWLTEKNYVITRDTTSLRGPVDGVYAIGDAAGYSLGGALDIIDAVRPLCSTILQDLSKGEMGKAQPFKQTVTETQLVPIGPSGGVGSAFGWRVPSFVVWLIKSRDYMIGMVPGVVVGDKFMKA